MTEKTIKTTRKNTGFQRNPLFPEKFMRGDLTKIAKMCGMHPVSVREVLIYGHRRNERIEAAARTVIAFNKKFLAQFPEKF